MGKKRQIFVLVSDDEDDDRKQIKNRSSSSSREKSSRRRGSSKKPNVGISRTRSFNQEKEAAEFDKLSEDFGDCLRDFSVVPGSKCTDMKETWVDKYKPRSFAELAVHKKKVDEVNQWLEERLMALEMLGNFGNSTLLITGQAGVGKSSTIHVIASHLGAELCEWTAPTPTLWREHVHNSNSGRHYMSKMDEFETFIEKVGKYSLLRTSATGVSRKPVVVLIDDLPVANGKITFVRLNKCLTNLVRSSRVPTVILITECHKTGSVYSSTDYLEELRTAIEKAGAHKVVFNPLTINSIKKTLLRICKEEKCDVTAEWIDYVAGASGGDIRHAVTSLQYLCLGPVDAFSLPVLTLPSIQYDSSVNKHNSLLSPSLSSSEYMDIRPSFSFGRDETLTLFHALGKFLHNKRETADIEQDSHVLRENLSRNPLKMDAPEKVLCQAHGQARNITDFLHENVLDFISDEAINDAWLVTSYLCDADFLLGGALRPARYNMMSEMYESENLVQSVTASVAARGVLFGNSHPAPSRWYKIRSPRLWQVEQLSRQYKSQMSVERFDNLNGCDLPMLAHVYPEYGSTIKWLRSKTSDDDSGWMNQENDEINSEEIEDDDIDDW